MILEAHAEAQIRDMIANPSQFAQEVAEAAATLNEHPQALLAEAARNRADTEVRRAHEDSDEDGRSHTAYNRHDDYQSKTRIRSRSRIFERAAEYP